MGVSYGEFQKVEDGEFARTLDWDTSPVFEGVYNGAITKVIKGKDRTFQEFTTEDGEDVQAWGTGVLDGRLKNVPVGNLVQITYLGKTLTNKAGQPMHNFDVLHADPVNLEA